MFRIWLNQPHNLAKSDLLESCKQSMRQLNIGSGEAKLYLTIYDRWRLAA